MTAKLPIVYNYQPFVKTFWIGQTNHKPSRIKAVNLSSGESITVTWDYALDVLSNHLSAAQALYKKLDQEIPGHFLMCGTHDQKGYIFTEAKK